MALLFSQLFRNQFEFSIENGRQKAISNLFRSGIFGSFLIVINYYYTLTKINLNIMKTKKLSTMILSLMSQCILQIRNNAFSLSTKKIQILMDKINQSHTTNHYSKQLYFQLTEKPQYNIEPKLNTKQNRILKELSVLIHFKLTEKSNSNVSFIESWHIAAKRTKRPLKTSKINPDQQLTYLLQQVLRGLKCQFLNDFSSSSQQLRNKYIVDYQIEINPSKKALRRLCSSNYESRWQKQALIDDQNLLAVTCYHKSHRKIKSILFHNRVQSHYQCTKYNAKHGSEQTKPSNSGQYELSTSTQERKDNTKERKTSLIQFYDQDLNITVLSNDSESFKKSTGRIEGIYVNQNLADEKNDKNDSHDDSDDQFQLLIEENDHEQNNVFSNAERQNEKLKQIEKQFQHFLHGLGKTMQDFFN